MEMLKKEPHVVAKLMSSPANAVPIELLQRMKTAGIAIQYCKLEHYSLAARARVGHTSAVFDALDAHLQQVMTDDDSLTVPPMEWIQNSCLQSIANAVNLMDDMGIQLHDQNHVQRFVIKQLRDSHFPVEAIAPQIKHRARLISTATAAQASMMLERTKQSATAIPQHIVLTFVRAWCQHWALPLLWFGQWLRHLSFCFV